jgi:hypothetical protein
MSYVKAYYNKRLESIVKDEELKNNIDIDQNKVEDIIKIGFFVKIVKQIIFIFCIAWFMGIIYYIYCDISNDLVDIGYAVGGTNNFIGNYFSGWNNRDRALGVLYYLFTTLSTVGFGDFHPINELECAFTALVLLTGVCIFGSLMGVFIEIMDDFLKLDEEFDDGDELSKFFGLIN